MATVQIVVHRWQCRVSNRIRDAFIYGHDQRLIRLAGEGWRLLQRRRHRAGLLDTDVQLGLGSIEGH